MARRLFNPLSNPPKARRWAASRLPRLIILAIGIHMLFCFILITQIHTHDEYVAKYNLLGLASGRPRQQNRKKDHRHGQMPSEDDYLYVEHLQNINKKLIETLNLDYSLSCRWRDEDGKSIFEVDCNYHRVNVNNNNNSSDRRIALFNPLEQDRILCDGTRIGPASILVLEKGSTGLPCSDPPRLFEAVPTLETKQQMEPIELKFRLTSRGKLQNFPCDVPCRSDEPMGVPGSRRVTGTPFTLQHSMEGQQYYPKNKYLPSAHRSYHYYSTTSFESEIPLPYFSFDEYGTKIQGPAINYTAAIKGAVFMARNCNSRNNREALVRGLIDSDFRVDSVSKCMHNAEVPDGLSTKKDIMKRYLFYLAFENQCENDYITEKLWETLEAGTVPVYYGALNADDHVPPNSIINAYNFNNSKDLADYLSLVASNKTLYESYHAWRTKPLPESFVTRYNMTRTHSTCRTCRWAAAKKYGLGWNHTTQTLEDLRIPRKVCYNSHHGLTHPFQESWLLGNDKRSPLRLVQDKSDGLTTSVHERCETQATKLSAFIRYGHHVVRRTIRSQDGVTDIHLEATKGLPAADSSFILQMKTTIDAAIEHESTWKAMSLRRYRFQDSTKRMTILTSRNIEANVAGPGVVELHIPHAQQATNIRLIVEDVEPYYDSAKRANYFARIMSDDFLNPLEQFIVWGSPSNQREWVGRSMNAFGIISSEDEEDQDDMDDELARQEEERKEAIKEKTDAFRQWMSQITKDENRTKAEKMALDGIKKLIADGIIKVNTD